MEKWEDHGGRYSWWIGKLVNVTLRRLIHQCPAQDEAACGEAALPFGCGAAMEGSEVKVKENWKAEGEKNLSELCVSAVKIGPDGAGPARGIGCLGTEGG